MGLGAAAVTTTLIAVTVVQGDADPNGDLLIVGLIGGMAVAAVFGWRRSDSLENVWQRGVVAVLAVFGALLIAFLFSIPARQLLGVIGLVILAAACLWLGIAGSRWSIRGRGTE